MKNFIYSDFSAKDALTLSIGSTNYEVTQFSSTWAANEVPSAVAMLATGRNVRTQEPAKIHTSNNHKQMERVFVYFGPKKEYSLDKNWPEGRQIIFEGFFSGYSYRKVNGKIQVTAHMIHWLAMLGCSSSLTQNGHVSNPTALNSAAVLQSLSDAGAGQGIYIADAVGAEIALPDVGSDLWVAIKNVFCKLADIETMASGPDDACLGPGTYTRNNKAIDALSRIEGPAPDCDVPYEYGVPLKIEGLDVDIIENAIATAIGLEFVASWSATSFWDKLVGQYCPMFGMAVVPMVSTALVVADTPAYRGSYWKEIEADDYDSLDMTSELHRPLRGVGVVVGWESQTQAKVEELESGVLIGGCYVADSVDAADGMLLFVGPPPWLSIVKSLSEYAGESTGVSTQAPSRTASTPVDPPEPTVDTFTSGATAVNRLCCKWAHDVYVTNMLRGRSGSFSGKLRFDIAPLSILKIRATGEKHIGPGQDNLAVTLYGCVQRVTITINAEAGLAGTSFSLSHIRTETENTEDRTSVTEHPLFGESIHEHGDGKHGSPLQPAYDLEPI